MHEPRAHVTAHTPITAFGPNYLLIEHSLAGTASSRNSRPRRLAAQAISDIATTLLTYGAFKLVFTMTSLKACLMVRPNLSITFVPSRTSTGASSTVIVHLNSSGVMGLISWHALSMQYKAVLPFHARLPDECAAPGTHCACAELQGHAAVPSAHAGSVHACVIAAGGRKQCHHTGPDRPCSLVCAGSPPKDRPV